MLLEEKKMYKNLQVPTYLSNEWITLELDMSARNLEIITNVALEDRVIGKAFNFVISSLARLVSKLTVVG